MTPFDDPSKNLPLGQNGLARRRAPHVRAPPTCCRSSRGRGFWRQVVRGARVRKRVCRPDSGGNKNEKNFNKSFSTGSLNPHPRPVSVYSSGVSNGNALVIKPPLVSRYRLGRRRRQNGRAAISAGSFFYLFLPLLPLFGIPPDMRSSLCAR